MDSLLAEMVELYKTTDMTYREISKRVGLNENQVGGRLKR